MPAPSMSRRLVAPEAFPLGRVLVVALFLFGLLSGGAAGAVADELQLGGSLRSYGPTTGQTSGKIVARLRALIADFQSLGVTPQNAPALGLRHRFSSQVLQVDDTGRVQVDVTVTDTSDGTLARLRHHGLAVEIVNTDLGIVEGWIPVDSLEPLAGEPAVVKIRPPSYPSPRTGSVNSQGDVIHRCNQVRTTTGITGVGAAVGVISDGVAGLAASQLSGDLPAVNVLANSSGDEGTAMLEIVHDCAPGAPLLFATGFPTALAFVNAVNALRAAGARVVVDDLKFFTEPYFQDGVIALNDRAVGNSVLRVAAAGNERRTHYAAVFSPGFFDGEIAQSRHDFGGGDTLLRFTVPGASSAFVILQWGNPFGASGDDYDLCVRLPTGALLGCAALFQDGDDDPIEILGPLNCGPGPACPGDLQVSLYAGAARQLKLFCQGCTFQEFAVAAGSITGHQAAPEVFAVAAAPASNPAITENFSSVGPSTILFPLGELRNKPDVTGIDGVATTRPGFNPFFGTSAAAPHVAAVAALVLQKNPAQTPSLVRGLLRGTATDIAPAGFDFFSGFGLVDALSAVINVPIFIDVPFGHFAKAHVQALFGAGVTGGCATAPPLYCPDNSVTREQMAVFLLKASGQGPGACTATFVDVPCSSPYAPWIYKLVALGITAGCGAGRYCPTDPVTREQMAVFLLRTKGDGPIACLGTFLDVSCASPFAGWIQRLVQLGITAGCQPGLYCPTAAVTRAQMAAFLVKMFNIPL